MSESKSQFIETKTPAKNNNTETKQIPPNPPILHRQTNGIKYCKKCGEITGNTCGVCSECTNNNCKDGH